MLPAGRKKITFVLLEDKNFDIKSISWLYVVSLGISHTVLRLTDTSSLCPQYNICHMRKSILKSPNIFPARRGMLGSVGNMLL